MNKEIENRVRVMFPNLSNKFENKVEELENTNTLSTENLWAGLSEKFADKQLKILAPIKDCIMDVQTDLQVRAADALPTVTCELVDAGEALVDCTNWEQSSVTSTYVEIPTHRISRPIVLTGYDLERGERVQSKLESAYHAVCAGVVAQFAAAIEDIDEEEISDFNAESCAALSGAFDSMETDTLLLSPQLYSRIVPHNALGINPAVDGAFGINKIFKSTGTGDIVAMTKQAVAGVIALPKVLENHAGSGVDVRVMGDIMGFPVLVKSHWTYNEEIQVSVECLCGFKVVDENGIRRFKLETEEPPTPSNFGNGPEEA